MNPYYHFEELFTKYKDAQSFDYEDIFYIAGVMVEDLNERARALRGKKRGICFEIARIWTIFKDTGRNVGPRGGGAKSFELALPEFLQKVALILPLYYVNEGLRSSMVTLNFSQAWLYAAVIGIFGIVIFILGVFLTSWKEE